MTTQIDETYELERETLVYDLEHALLMLYPPAHDWFSGEDEDYQDELLEEMAHYLWAYPDAAKNDAIYALAKKIIAIFKADHEIAPDGRG